MKNSITLGTTQAGLGELAWHRFARLVAGFRHANARRKAYNALAALDDRTLADIGVSRTEIWRTVDEVLGDEQAALRETRGGRAAKSIAA